MSVLWGFSSDQPTPIKLTGGTLSECVREQKFRESIGWTCAIYREFAIPQGLRDMAAIHSR